MMASYDKDSTKPEQFSMTDLRTEFDVTPRALRFYGTKGLLSPSRRGSTRVYDRADRARLKLILKGKRFGFTLGEIKEMLDLYSVEDNGAEQRRVTSDKYRKQIVFLREQINEMCVALNELEIGVDKIDRIRAENGEL